MEQTRGLLAERKWVERPSHHLPSLGCQIHHLHTSHPLRMPSLDLFQTRRDLTQETQIQLANL